MAIPKRMYAAVLKGPGTVRSRDRLELKYVDTPKPSPDEVLVKILACGFCQTDYKGIMGYRSFPMEENHIPGHEPAGVIAAVGAGVSGFEVEDRVAISPLEYCGECVKCKKGDDHTEYCLNSIVLGGDGPKRVKNGAFAQYMLANHKSVYKIPDDVSLEDAALCEPAAGGYKGLTRAHFKVGDNVVVVGVGGIGMIVALLAKQMGADPVVAVDVSDYALGQASRFGIDQIVNPNRLVGRAYDDRDIQRIRDHIYDEVLHTCPDIVVEAAGPEAALKLTLGLAGQSAPFLPEARDDSKGISYSIFGITAGGVLPFDFAKFHFSGGDMNTSFNVNPHSMRKAIEAIRRGLNPARIITHRYTLEEFDAAIDKMGEGDRNKVMIYPNPRDLSPEG